MFISFYLRVGYYKYNEEGKRYYVPGEFCAYEFDEVLHVVHRLQYQLYKQVEL